MAKKMAKEEQAMANCEERIAKAGQLFGEKFGEFLANAGVDVADQEQLDKLAIASNLYPSSMRCFLEGSVIPSQEVLQTICTRLQIDVRDAVAFNHQRVGVVAGIEGLETKLQDEYGISSSKGLVMGALGAVTLDTKLGGPVGTEPAPLLHLLLSTDSSFSPEEISQGSQVNPDVEYLAEATLSDIKMGKRGKQKEGRLYDRNTPPYKKETIETLCWAFGLEGNSTELLKDLSFPDRKPHRPVSKVLEEAVKQGKGFVEFFRGLLNERGLSHARADDEFGFKKGFAHRVIQTYDKRDKGQINSHVVEAFVEGFELSGASERMLWRMMKGTDPRTVEEIVVDAEKYYNSRYPEYSDVEGMRASLLDDLINSTGLAVAKISELTGIPKNSIENWRKDGIGTGVSSERAEKLAVMLVGESGELATRLQKVFLGKVFEKDEKELLDTAYENLAEEMAAIDDPKERIALANEKFSTILVGVQKKRRAGHPEVNEGIKSNGVERGISKTNFSGWINGGKSVHRNLAVALGKWIGYAGEDLERFAKLAQGRPPFYDPGVLERYYAEEITRSECLSQLVANTGHTKEEFGKIVSAGAGRWFAEGLIPEDRVLESAAVMNIPEKGRRKFEIHFVKNKRNMKDEEEKRERPGEEVVGVESKSAKRVRGVA